MATAKQKQNVLQWAYHKCNLAGDQANLYDVIYDYKTIWEAADDVQDAIMDYIVTRMGLASYSIFTDEKHDLLLNEGWIAADEV